MNEAIVLFIDYLKNEKRYSKHTLSAYKRDIKQFETFLSSEGIKLDDTQTVDIRNWVISLKNKGHHASTINRKVASVSSFFQYLLKCQKTSKNPVEGVHRPKEEKKTASFITEKSINKLLDLEFPSEYNGLRDRTIITLLYATGMRRSELIELKDKDWNRRAHTLSVLGKGGKERILPLYDEVTHLLETYVVCRNRSFTDTRDDNLLLSIKGKKLSPSVVYRTVKKHLMVVSNQEKVTPHTLRHTFATHLLNNHADLNAIKELLGHSSLSATQIYTHTSFRKLVETYKKAHPRKSKT